MLSLGGGRAGAQDGNKAEITEDSSLLAFLTSNEKFLCHPATRKISVYGDKFNYMDEDLISMDV